MKAILLATLLACIAIAFSQRNPLKGYLLVVNSGNDTVSLINMERKVVEKSIQTGKNPREIAISMDEKYAVVSNYLSKPPTLTVISLETKKMVRNIVVEECLRPFGIGFKDNDHTIVACSGINQLFVINIHDGQIAEKIKTTPLEPHLLTINKNKTLAFTDDMHRNEVAAVDLSHKKTIKMLQSGKTPSGLHLNLDNSEVWVCNYEENTLSIINVRELKVIGKLKTGKQPFRVKFAEPNLAIVTNHGEDTAWIYDTESKKKIHELRFEGTNVTPKQISVYKEHAFIGLYETGQVAIVNLKNFKIEGYLKGFKGPSGMSYIPL